MRPPSPTGTNVADFWLLLREDCDGRLVPLEESPGLQLSGGVRRPGPALLTRGELRRALMRATAAPASPLEVMRAWDPADEALADGGGVVLREVDAGLAKRLRGAGLSPDSCGLGRWRLDALPAGVTHPAWT